MITEVDKYRGWEISFDTDREAFTAYSNAYDNEIKEKQSYAATKKAIDDFIKDNETFKPFYVVDKMGDNKVQIIGMRKDNRFIQVNSKGEKSQFSSYREDDYFIYKPEIDPHIAEYNRLYEIADNARKEAEAYRKAHIKGKTLTEYKKDLLG